MATLFNNPMVVFSNTLGALYRVKVARQELEQALAYVRTLHGYCGDSYFSFDSDNVLLSYNIVFM